MDSLKKLNITLTCEPESLPIYHEHCTLLEKKIILVRSALLIETFDVIIIPSFNALGIITDQKLNALLEQTIGVSYVDSIKHRVLVKFHGRMPVGASLVLEFQIGEKVMLVCIVCVARVEKMVPVDFAFNGIWSAFNKLKNWRVKKNVRESWDVVIGSLTYLKGLPRDVDNIAEQFSFAIDQLTKEASLLDTESLDSLLHFILHPRIKSIQERKDELEGFMWSKELDKRGLLSVVELDIMVGWVADDAPNALSSASSLCYFLTNENPFALKSSIIAKAITKNNRCLQALIGFIETGKIKPYNEITMDQLDLGDKIGAGKSSNVYEATYQNSLVSIKQVNDDTDRELLKEIAFLMLLRSSYIIDLIGVNVRNDRFIATELMQGSLFELLGDSSLFLPTEVSMIIAIKCATCMNFFQSCGLIHRDLKSLNILFSREFEFKLCDFGMSCSFKEDRNMTANIGTVAWIAPEVFQNKNYNSKVDVYSFGIILWEILTRQEPFANLGSISIPMHVLKGDRPPIPKFCDERYKKLMKKCWDKRPTKRPNFSSILVTLREIYSSLVAEKKQAGEESQVIYEIWKTSNGKKKSFQASYTAGVINPNDLSMGDTEEDMGSTSSMSETKKKKLFRLDSIPVLNHPENLRNNFHKARGYISDFSENLYTNLETGIIDNIYAERFLLLNGSSLSSHLSQLLQSRFMLSKSLNILYTKHFMYEIGFQMGHSDSEMMSDLTGEESRECTYLLPYYLGCMGWSTCETLDGSVLELKDFFWVTRHNYTFTDEEEEEVGCNIIAGYMAGWCTHSLGKTIMCVEYHCKCRSSKHCEFALGTRKSLSKKLRSFKKSNASNYSQTLQEEMIVPEFLVLHHDSFNWIQGFANAILTSKSKKKKRKRKKSNVYISRSNVTIKGNRNQNHDRNKENPEPTRSNGRIKISDSKYVVVRAWSLISVCQHIKVLFGHVEVPDPTLSSLLFSRDIGYVLGKRDSEILALKYYGNPVNELCTEAMRQFGWGLCKIEPGTSASTIKIYHSAERENDQCTITEGYLEGFFSSTDIRCCCIETECTSTECTFILSKSSSSLIRHLQQEESSDLLIQKAGTYSDQNPSSDWSNF